MAVPGIEATAATGLLPAAAAAFSGIQPPPYASEARGGALTTG